MPYSFVYRESCLTGTHFEECQLQFLQGQTFTKFVLEFYGLRPKEKM